MTVPLRVHAATHVGLVHGTNEDSWAVTPTQEGGLLLLVCDGMGGMGRGDEASAAATHSITHWMETGTGLPPERLRQAIRQADRDVREALCNGPQPRHPGSTAVMAYVIDGAAHIAWAGDSRAYLLRDHRVVERTRDHKLVEDLIDSGQLSPEEARFSDFAHVVTRALGGRATGEPDVRPANLSHPWKLAHDDTIVVCSDGLCDLVSDDELPGLITGLPPDRATERLIEVALERGGHDNITVIVARWEGATYREDDVATPVMRAERQHLPDLRMSSTASEVDLDPGDNVRVTEEIERSELERIIGATPSGVSHGGDTQPVAVGAGPSNGPDRDGPLPGVTPVDTGREHRPADEGHDPSDELDTPPTAPPRPPVLLAPAPEAGRGPALPPAAGTPAGAGRPPLPSWAWVALSAALAVAIAYALS